MTPYAPVRTRRLRGVDPNLSNHLRRDIGLPDAPSHTWLDLTGLLLWRS
jgi:hypothetical protein